MVPILSRNITEHPLSTSYVLLAGLILFAIHACSSSEKMVAPVANQEVTVDGDLSDWPHTKAMIKESNSFNYYAMHKEDHLYLFINMKNIRYKNLVEDAGFTIYISGEKKNKKALGITYPVGAYNFLKQRPGQYRQFKQNKEWLKKPENQELLEELKEENYNKAMITQREHKKQTPQEVIVDLKRLEAQGIQIEREQRHNRVQIELSIPLKSTKTQQFAVAPSNNRSLQVGFAVDPPDKDWDNESTTVDLSRQQDNRGPYGRRRDRQKMEQRLGQLTSAHDNWFEITLAPSEE